MAAFDWDDGESSEGEFTEQPRHHDLEAGRTKGIPDAPAFCHDCGSPLNGLVECPACADKHQRAWQVSRERLDETGSVKSSIVLYFVLLMSFAIIFIDPENVHLEMAVGIIDALIVMCWVIYQRRQILPILKLPSKPAWLLAGIVTGVFTFAVTTVFIRLVAALFDLPIIRMTDGYFEAGYGVGAALLFMVLQPAIVEEFAFRGVIFNALKRQLTITEAMLVSSCMFAALHLSPLAFPHTFLIGILSVMMVYQSRSIWPGVLLHGVHNFLVMAEEIWWS